MAIPYVAMAGMAVDLVQKLASTRTEEAFEGLNPSAVAGGPITVTIPTAGQVTVPHGLGQVPQNGWQLQCKMGQGDVWEYQAADANHFYFETDAVADLQIKITAS